MRTVVFVLQFAHKGIDQWTTYSQTSDQTAAYIRLESCFVTHTEFMWRLVERVDTVIATGGDSAPTP